MIILEIVIVFILFLVNGFFTMAELAIVSSRRSHLEHQVKEGHPGAQIALALANDPARMLATVQIGFTGSAMLAGIFSGATLADRFGEVLEGVPYLAGHGRLLAILVVTAGVTYAAIIVGELAPKHIALNNPELIAVRVARPLAFISRIATPLIKVLNFSTEIVLRLLHLRSHLTRSVTEEDIHYVVAEGARLGVIHAVERDMIEGVLDLADTPVRSIMTPRPRVQWVDADGRQEEILKKVRTCPHAQLVVCRGSLDQIDGIIRKQDLIDQVLAGDAPDVTRATHDPLIVPESTSVLRTLDLFRKTPVHTAIVVDEFGMLQGIVTRTDLLETVAGDLPGIDAPVRAKIPNARTARS